MIPREMRRDVDLHAILHYRGDAEAQNLAAKGSPMTMPLANKRMGRFLE
jgi:hypothetical protein